MAWNKRLCVRSDANVYVLYKGTFCALVSSGQHCHSVAVFSLCLRLSLNLNRNVDLEHMLPFFSFYLPKPKPTSSSVSSWFFYTSDSDKQRFDDFITIKKKPTIQVFDSNVSSPGSSLTSQWFFTSSKHKQQKRRHPLNDKRIHVQYLCDRSS